MAKKQTGNKTNHHNPTSGRGEGPNPIDIHVGKRLTELRTLRGLTQGQLGVAIGVSFQQIQKYERGANRVSASKLYQIAKTMGVAVGYFFEDMPDIITQTDSLADVDVVALGECYDEMHRRQQLELNRLFSKAKDRKLRKKFLDLAAALFNTDSEIAA